MRLLHGGLWDGTYRKHRTTPVSANRGEVTSSPG